MRSIPFYPMMVLLLIGLGGYLGCDPNSISISDPNLTRATSDTSPRPAASIPQRSPTTILIGSFNMQRFGPTKLSDPWVMEKFATIIQQFDLLALQEITSQDQRTLPALVELINRSGHRYAYAISPRIGRTSYLEQYAFVFDTQRIRGGADYCYVVQDDRDALHREPFVGRFQTVSPRPFGFTLINMHTDPDEIAEELDVLADVYINVRQFEYDEDDVMLLGDLNAPPDRHQRLGQIPGMVALIQGTPTNTRRNKTLDNILVDSQMTREFTGRAGTIDLESMFGVELSDAERISDHLPVWGEFSIEEFSTSAMANAASGTLR